MLIVCEGKTEPIYFTSLARHRRLTSVEAIPSERGSNPRSVVEDAVEKKVDAEKSKERYAQVWCVFDRDAHEWVDEAFALAMKHGIAIAFSNPCFEIWYLQHLRENYSFAHTERDDAKSEVRHHVTDYCETKCVYHDIVDRQSVAFQRAEWLRRDNRSAGKEENDNPSTTVDVVVKVLNALGDGSA